MNDFLITVHNFIRRPRSMRAFTAAGVALTLLLVLLSVNACGSREQQADPYARYRPALKEEFQSDLDILDGAPIYSLNVEVNPETSVMTGTGVIELTNYSADPWNELVFRLYPMLDQYKGNLLVRGAVVNGQPVSFNYLNESTAIKVDLAEPLEPGEQATVRMNWGLEYPTWSDNSRVYVLYGASQDMISLPLFYPSLAVYEDGPAPGTGRWWMDEGTVRGDAAFNVASLFAVTATLPADQVPVTSGTLITSTILPDGRVQRAWVTGPSREFLLHMSPRFQSASYETNGTRVTSYWLPEDEAAGKAALRYAVAALRIYSRHYGEYPFRDMRIAPAPINYRGMEYPQVALMGVELYNKERTSLEDVVSHEVAHQWWYQIVHNDPVNAPWLDEALAEYSMKRYMEDLHGDAKAERMQRTRWDAALEMLRQRVGDAPVGMTVDEYEDGGQYETVVYGKGALFYDALRDRLGDRRFDQFLRDYLDEHRYGIVTVNDWLTDLQALDDPALVELYQKWIKPQATAPAVLESLPTPTPGSE
jgi:hypothetical protein